MAVEVTGYLNAILLWIHLQPGLSSYVVVEKEPAALKEYCMSEPFQPRCLKNEVILMKSATYGRMRVGRCVPAEEVDAHRLLSGDDPRFLGCSADVLSLLDRKCSGTTECDIRLSDIAAENIKPCYPGLTVYLEVSYDCVNIADDERSCSLLASTDPVHIIGSSVSKRRMCGTKSQPWLVEAPAGQRLRISLLDFTASTGDNTLGQRKQPCSNYGVIVDMAAKRNVTICGGGEHRTKELHISRGNDINIIFNSENEEETVSDNKRYLLAVTTVGCSDIIPPEDAWLKRNVDAIVIGCYTSRQTWHLNCEAGNWIGVFGNCSQGGMAVHYSVAEMELIKSESWSNGQVLAMVSIGGLTVAVCLAIACMGVVYFRRFSFRGKKKPDFQTINFPISSRTIRQTEQNVVSPSDLIGSDLQTPTAQQGPTYSVFIGATDLTSIAE